MNWSLINEQRIFAFAMASLACMPHHLLSANKHSGLLAKDYQRQMENPKYRKRDGRENAGRENLSQIVRHSVWFIDIEFGAMFGCAISISGHFRIVGVFFSFHFTSLLFGWYAVIGWLLCGVNEKKSWRNAARQNECGEQLQISRKEICSVNWNEDEVSNGNCCWFEWTVSNVKRTMELCGWAMLVDCCILIYYTIIYQTVRRNDISFLRPHSPSTVNVLCHVDFIEVDFYYYWPN